VALLDALSLNSLVTVYIWQFGGRGIERLGGSRWLLANIKTGGASASPAAPPRIISIAPLRHCSILFAARLAGLFMANIASQKKRIARSERERLENLRFRSSVKTYFKRLEGAIQSGDANTVSAEHRALISRIDKAVQRGALHRNTGARKKARAAGLVGGASQSRG
jgi:small subunit ribosomal protein S20